MISITTFLVESNQSRYTTRRLSNCELRFTGLSYVSSIEYLQDCFTIDRFKKPPVRGKKKKELKLDGVPRACVHRSAASSWGRLPL